MCIRDSREHHVEDLVVDVGQLLLVDDEEGGDHEHHEPVAEVAEHHREQKGEGDDGEHRRVHLAVARHAVRLHNVLEHLRHLVRLEERRGGLPRAQLLEYRVHLTSAVDTSPPGNVRASGPPFGGGPYQGALVGGAVDGVHEAAARHCRAPALRDEALAGHVDAQLVQRVVHRLLARHLRRVTTPSTHIASDQHAHDAIERSIRRSRSTRRYLAERASVRIETRPRRIAQSVVSIR
eukprot:4335673-Pyramimonas_sp.AAC.2